MATKKRKPPVKKSNNTPLIIGGVVIAAAGLTYYLYNRKKDRDAAAALAIQQQSAAATAGANQGSILLDAISNAANAAAADSNTSVENWALQQPTIRRGDRNEAVKTLQKLLNITSDATGTFGSTTDGVVRQYQNAKSLTPDGVVGLKTWTALKKDFDTARVTNMFQIF
jgi:peptidoglycan hydrolase-like protein with peptidoglycan-binding domain